MIRALLRIAAVIVLAAVLGAAWLYRPGEMADAAAGAPGSASEAMGRIRAMMEGEAGEVSLTGGEIAALLAGPLAEYLPGSVGTPQVALADGTVRAVLPLPLESALPLPEVPVVAGVIPDTLRAAVTALVSSADGSFSVHVERLALGGVPLPRFLLAGIARRLEIGGMIGLAGTAAGEPLTWPLPPAVEAIYINGDRLVLRAGR